MITRCLLDGVPFFIFFSSIWCNLQSLSVRLYIIDNTTTNVVLTHVAVLSIPGAGLPPPTLCKNERLHHPFFRRPLVSDKRQTSKRPQIGGAPWISRRKMNYESAAGRSRSHRMRAEGPVEAMISIVYCFRLLYPPGVCFPPIRCPVGRRELLINGSAYNGQMSQHLPNRPTLFVRHVVQPSSSISRTISRTSLTRVRLYYPVRTVPEATLVLRERTVLSRVGLAHQPLHSVRKSADVDDSFHDRVYSLTVESVNI